VEFFGGLPKEVKFFMRRFVRSSSAWRCDQTVPVQEAFDLQKILEKKQIPYEMQIYPGVGHGFTEKSGKTRRSLAAFLQNMSPCGIGSRFMGSEPHAWKQTFSNFTPAKFV